MSGNVSQDLGPISWMLHNRVTPNLLMILLVLGGLFMATRIKQEVFPEFDLDIVTVSVDYSGASPEEVEQGILLVVEEAIRAIDGVPITFSILINVVVFLPLSFIPGTMGKIWKVIPLVVITVFLISWVESLLILPGHLAHLKRRPAGSSTSRLQLWQQAFTGRVTQFINQADVTAVLPVGSPMDKVKAVQEKLCAAMTAVAAENGGDLLLKGVFSRIDENQVEVSAYLTALSGRCSAIC